jgi:protein TonB
MADSNPAQPTSNEPTPPSNGSSDGFADLGLMMGNGSGGGLSVPASQRRVAEAPRQEEVHKVRAFAPTHDACDQPPTKAKLHGALIKPTYTDAARTAQIEGVVRIELTVDEQGGVIDVKVLRGLGYGLDESAVAAAKKLAFEPGTRCNKAAVTKLTVGMRFTLQQ